MSDDPSRSDAPSDPSLREELNRQLAALAGPGAIDCGFATDTVSAERVDRLATAALAGRQPFYCMYRLSSGSPSPIETDGFPPPPPPWPWPAGYVGRADGVVFAVRETREGTLVRGRDVLGPGAPASPRRLGLGMTIPVVVSSPTATLDGDAGSIQGIVIVAAAIGTDGSVADTRVLKPLPLGIADVAEGLVRQSIFRPGRFFGVPIPVVQNVIVDSRTGLLSVRRPAEAANHA